MAITPEKSITYRLPVPLVDRLDALARETGKSRRSILIAALEAALRHKGTKS